MRSGDMKRGRIFKEGVFGPIILNSRSIPNTESENIYVDYDSSGHVYYTIPKCFHEFFIRKKLNYKRNNAFLRIFEKAFILINFRMFLEYMFLRMFFTIMFLEFDLI
jgi:hypothetical protein